MYLHFIKSCEKGLIAKERMITHMHLKIVLKWAVHFSTLAITRFSSAKKLFQAAINTATLRASLLLNASPPVRHTHF